MPDSYSLACHDVEVIKNAASFLEELGYAYKYHLGGIDYEKSNVLIRIHGRYHNENADVTVKFIDQNRLFSLTWFICYYNDMNYNIPEKDIDHICDLLKLLKERFSKITDFMYCCAVSQQIEEALAKMHPTLGIAEYSAEYSGNRRYSQN